MPRRGPPSAPAGVLMRYSAPLPGLPQASAFPLLWRVYRGLEKELEEVRVLLVSSTYTCRKFYLFSCVSVYLSCRGGVLMGRIVCLYVCVCICICVCVCIWRGSICLGMCSRVCMWMCLCLCVSICVSVNLSCKGRSVNGRDCVSLRVCVSVYVSVYVCVWGEYVSLHISVYCRGLNSGPSLYYPSSFPSFSL